MRTLARFLVLFLFLGAGVWLLARSAPVSVETPARQQAMLALGPAGADAIDFSAAAEPQMRTRTFQRVGVITPADIANAPAPDPQAFVERYLNGEVDVENFVDAPYSEAYLLQRREAALRRPVDANVQVDDANAVDDGVVRVDRLDDRIVDLP